MKSEFIVEPKSRGTMRRLAYLFREELGLQDTLYFPIVELLDSMRDAFPEFTYEIVTDEELPKNVHADTDITRHHVRIKESVYDGAVEGSGRDRMTIAHELGHYVTLCVCGFTLARNFGEEDVPAYKSPEWQAKCFAGELMVAEHLTRDMSVEEIVESCGVSEEAAAYQYKKMHEEDN